MTFEWEAIAKAWRAGAHDTARAQLATALAEPDPPSELLALQLQIAAAAGEDVDFSRASRISWKLAAGTLLDWGEVDALGVFLPEMIKLYRGSFFFTYLERLFAAIPAGQPPFVDDPRAFVQVAPHAGADTVVFAFTGGSRRLGIPVTIMQRFFAARGVHVVYLRDANRQMYRNGVTGLGGSRATSLDALRAIASDLGATRIVTFGASMGGYAALWYGLDLGAEAVLALSASTRLDVSRMTRRWRLRAEAELGRALVDSDLEPFNLRALYEGAPKPPRVRLVYSAELESDRQHAENMAGLPRVALDALEGEATHSSWRLLVVSGGFEETLDWLVANDVKPASFPSHRPTTFRQRTAEAVAKLFAVLKPRAAQRRQTT